MTISTNEDGSHDFGDVKGVKSQRNVINFPFFNCLSSFKVKLRNYIENLAQGLNYWCIGGRKAAEMCFIHNYGTEFCTMLKNPHSEFQKVTEVFVSCSFQIIFCSEIASNCVADGFNTR